MTMQRPFITVKQLRAVDLRVGDVVRITGTIAGWLRVTSTGVADNGTTSIAFHDRDWQIDYDLHDLFDVQVVDRSPEEQARAEGR